MYFLPLALLVIAAATYFYQSEKSKNLVSTTTGEQAIVILGKHSIDVTLEDFSNDILFVANEPSFKSLLDNPRGVSANRLAQGMLNFSRSHAVFDQIRWIDETGMERFRINRNGGHPTVVPEAQLQNKKDRYYFTESMAFNPGEVYVSPLDLNVEHGQVEIPYKPMIRIATPVADSAGHRRGIVVLNYLGQQLLDRFTATTQAARDHTMLVNNLGYYLASPRREDEWGFMFKRDHLTLGKMHPAAWRHIVNAEKGQFLDADGLWTFDTVHQIPVNQASGHSATLTHERHWKIVTFLPAGRLFAKTSEMGRQLLGGVAMILVLLLWGSWQLARAGISRLRAEADLRIAATAFESHEGMIVTDANGTILRVNSAFTKVTGYSEQEAIGKNPKILQSGHHDAAYYAEMWKQINHEGVWEGEIWNRRKNGEVYPEHITITTVRNRNGAIVNYVATFNDTTLSKEAENEIRSLAFYDSLTGLPNRRLLLDRLQQVLVSSARNGKEGALLFIDLDNFKTLNDTRGHDIGDLLLQQVARRLEACVREDDTVARLGGDEFVVMLEGLSEHAIEAAAQTETIGEKIQAALTQPYQLATHEYRSTPSIGATLFSGHHLGIEEVLKQADIAMYQAKKAGRNTLRFFDPQMQASITARAALESDMRRALDENQFELYYQPQVTGDRRLIGAEVLIRWNHPERGLIFPDAFIPLAEETGMILPIGQWVIEAACAQLRKWEQSAATRHLQLSVNVSARQFHQADFAEMVLRILTRNAVSPDLLKLELTESLVLDDVDDIIMTMRTLREGGVRFSMDDFGTGHSSLSSLKKLPLDQLKIDQSFVRDLATDPDDAVIVQTIIAMANNLGMDVIAEGVETETQRIFLKQHQCLVYQGHLFSRALPIDQFEAWADQVFHYSDGAS